MVRIRRTIVTAQQRAKTAGRKSARISKQWYDPTPEIDGTHPEKLVINRLILMQIPFVSQGYVNINIPEIDLNKDYRPDILIPDIKLIIQVQGAYWHSKPAQIDADAYLNALYEAVGYRVIDWWDYDIETNLDALFQSEPQLANWQGRRGGRETAGLRQSDINDTKGIATLNRKKARGAKAARSGRKALKRPTLRVTSNRLKGSRVI
jgi:hypothetical protein